ncbi:MAG: ABC transporter ATP-binding protein, partial [Calditrichaeota bacterium]
MSTPSTQNSLRLYGRILSYLRPYLGHIGLILVFNFGFIVFNTLSVWLVAPFVSTLFQEQPAVEKTVPEEGASAGILNLNDWLKARTATLIRREDRLEMLKILALLVFLGFLLKNAFAFGEAFLVSFVEQRVIKDLRDQLYAHVVRQPLQFFERYSTGNLISRITNDINALNVAVNRSFTKIIRDPLLILIFVILLVSISWQLTLLAFLVIPLSGFIIQKIGQSLKRKSHRVQERIADLTSILQETIAGIKVVKAFGMEAYEIDRFRRKTEAHFRAVLRQVRLNRLSGPLSETLGIGIMASVLWFGGQLVLAGRLLSAEDFIRFLAILFSV